MEQQLGVIMTSVQAFLNQLAAFLPRLLAAVVILVLGWFIAKLLNFVVVRGLKLVGFQVVTEGAGIDGFLKKGNVRKSAIEVLGALIYWLVILMTLLVAFDSLGLTIVSDLFSRVTQYIPNVVAAVLILTIGLYFARFVADAVTAYAKNVGSLDADLIGRVTRYAISIFVFVIALGQMRIGDVLLYNAILIILAAFGLAFGIAFGLGGQKWAAGQIEKFMKERK
jgi:hypothetical protein